jgi:hypothetical protein
VVADWRVGLREGVSARPSAFPLGKLSSAALDSSSGWPADEENCFLKTRAGASFFIAAAFSVPCHLCIKRKKRSSVVVGCVVPVVFTDD